MRKVMRRFDQSQKEINFYDSWRKYLEKLRELQRCGRLDNQWLKERFGERGEGFKGGSQEKGTLGEIRKGVRIDFSTEEEYLAET
jgi:hypothetical protein